jgi:RHS repeat-associated protein
VVHPGTSVRRDLCLAMSVGPGAAYECADLRLVHALPTTRVLNAPRTPVLLYNSQHAQPRPVVPFNLHMTPGSAPTSVTAILRVGPIGGPQVERGRQTWTGSWQAGGLWRFAVSYDAGADDSDVYAYSLQVLGTFGGVQREMQLYTGELAVVNRSRGPAGPSLGGGWGVAGVEQLIWLRDGARALVIGGDGSTRVYRWQTTGVNVAENVDRPDTLRSVYIDAQLHSFRRLPNGSEVWYDPAGRHYKTITRLRHTTSFVYDGGRLHQIILPMPANSSSSAAYVFGYNTANGGRLDWICAIVSGTNCRNTIVHHGHNDHRITGITDLDSTVSTFGYEGANGRVRRLQRTDSSAVTSFGYDAAGKLTEASLPVPEAGYTIRHGFTPGESRGLLSAIASSSAGTLYDGPRPDADVADHTFFWLNRWGAPTRIRGAGGDTTFLTRSDSRFPALVTRVDYPNDTYVSAEYDGRGNLKAQTDWSTSRLLANGSRVYATTRYERTDTIWRDFVTQVTSPEGEVSKAEYRGGDGNVVSQQVGTDAARRIRIEYNSLGLVERVVQPATATQAANGDILRYDAVRGNLESVTTPRGARTVFYNDLLGRTYKTVSLVDTVRTLVQENRFYPNSDRVELSWTIGPAMNGVGEQTVWVRTTYDPERRVRSVSRWSRPDTVGIGAVTTSWTYDAAGRKTAEIAPDGEADRYQYDAASNLVRVRTRNFTELLRAAGGDSAAAHIVTRYDVLNRPYERIVPAVHYRERRAGVAAGAHGSTLKQRPYPHYPNDGGLGLRIAGDTVRFVYDLMGNMIRAQNHDSWIRRSYYPNGMLKGDTLKVRTLEELAQGGDSTSHVYALLHVYDLNGRRRELHHPPQLAARVNGAAPRPTRFGYDPDLGVLSSVTDPLGSEFRYEYDTRGQQQALSLPGGIRETYGYDEDGNLTNHRVFNGVPSSVAYRYPGNWIRDETLEYDLRGKMLETRNLYGNRDAVSVRYSGLGHMVQTTSSYYGFEFDTDQSTRYTDIETPRHDALGNIYSMQRSGALKVFERSWLDAGSAHDSNSNTIWTYQPRTGRLLLRTTITGVDSTHYDSAGNIVFTNQTASAGDVAFDRASFYDGEGRLRVVDSRRVENFGARTAPFFHVFEEYRYDALGRRVLVHTRKDCQNVGQDLRRCAVGSLRRTVWDGSAELYDIQVPTPNTENALVNVHFTTAELESDTNPVRASLGNWDGFDPHPMYGRVAYTYGHAIDKPLSIIRMNYADHPYGSTYTLWNEPFAIVPHWNTRGAAQTGTYANGARYRCLEKSSRCVALDWPDGWFPYNPARLIPEHWHGSLLSEKRDGSGLLYRRNRYYDPSSGRFTQEDPIGLAGGLNVYGFAAGDPVTYSDPYGLSAQGGCENPEGPGVCHPIPNGANIFTVGVW